MIDNQLDLLSFENFAGQSYWKSKCIVVYI